MPWYAQALLYWVAASFTVYGLWVLALEATGLWHTVLTARTVRRQDKRWAADNGIDLHTTYPRFLPGERLP